MNVYESMVSFQNRVFHVDVLKFVVGQVLVQQINIIAGKDKTLVKHFWNIRELIVKSVLEYIANPSKESIFHETSVG